MSKSAIVKIFIGSLIGFVAALVLFAVAGGLALRNDSFIMDGPDVVGVRPDPFGWTMIGLAGLAVVMMIAAALGLFIAWIGAVLNTANLPDKTWFVILLVGGLLGVGFAVTLVYVIAGPDGQRPVAHQAREWEISPPPQPPVQPSDLQAGQHAGPPSADSQGTPSATPEDAERQRGGADR